MPMLLYRASNLKSTITFLALPSQWKSVSGDCKKLSFLAIFHNNNNNHFYRYQQLLQTAFLRLITA